jgi:hypothetical protein
MSLKFKRSVSYCRIFSFFCLPFVCLLAVADGQLAEESRSNESNESSEPSSGRLAWFIQTSIPDGFKNPAMVKSGKDVVMLTLSNRSASRAVSIPEDGVLQFVKEIPNPQKKDAVIYQVLAQAVIPKDVERALVIMHPTPDPKEGGPVFISKVQSLSEFKGGDHMYINLTPTNIGVEIAEDKLGLTPGAMVIQTIKGVDSVQSIPYRYSYYNSDKQRWMTLSASMTISSPSRREVFIFSLSQNTGRIRCKGITIPVVE